MRINMKKTKNNKKTKSILGGIGLVAISALVTLGGVRLFSRNDKNFKQLLTVNLDADFFKAAKEGTETISELTYQTFTKEIKKNSKTTYEFKLVVYSGESKDFADELSLDATATSAYVQVTNLNASLCEVYGLDDTNEKKANETVDRYLVDYTEATKTVDEYSRITLNPAGNVVELQSISFYGI